MKTRSIQRIQEDYSTWKYEERPRRVHATNFRSTIVTYNKIDRKLTVAL